MTAQGDEQHLGDDGSVTLRPVSAIVPEQVSRGVFSTGVIAITGNTEFVLDFVLNVGAPSTVVARVICPHEALSRIVAAIQRNVEAFTQRGGTAGSEKPLVSDVQPGTSVMGNSQGEQGAIADSIGNEQFVGASIPIPDQETAKAAAGAFEVPNAGDANLNAAKQSPLDLYDDIIVPDDIQVGVYANGLIIGHTNSEFKLDFVSNMFPKSVVTSRIFMSAPQLIRLLDTLNRTWHQFDEKRKS